MSEKSRVSSKIPSRVLGFLLLAGFVITGTCMFYLTRTGVSLRSAPIISPSPIKADLKEMADSLFVRLLPEFQPHHYIVWGVLPFNDETQALLNLMKERYQQVYKAKVQTIPNGVTASAEEIGACQTPCWIYFPASQVHELQGQQEKPRNFEHFSSSYQSVSILEFDRPTEKPVVNPECLDAKILGLECLKQISLRDAWKKMKSPQERYFFVRQYNQKDLFLFIQKQ